MTKRILLLVTVCLFLSACYVNPVKKVYSLRHRTVYMFQKGDNSSNHLPASNGDTSYIEFIFKNYDLVNIKTLDPGIRVNLRYADTNNFLRRNFYDGLQKAYFTCDAALKICAAQFFLKQADSSLTLEILDASRPWHIQQMMWDSLKTTEGLKTNYLSHPDLTSLHNYGCAVDVTVFNTRTGQYLDMGTEFDTFEKLSQPFYEMQFLKNGELSQAAYNNRWLLRSVMKRAGLNPITSEWWHFSVCKKEEAVKKYTLIQ